MVGNQEIARAPHGATAGARAAAGFFFATLLAAVIGLGGCISLPQSEALRAAAPADLPSSSEIPGITRHRQDDFLCGPAALATAFNAAGVTANVESLTPLVYLPGRQGSLQAEMLGATRRSGLVAYTVAPEYDAVLREVAAGTPVVVLLNLALRLFPVWHYAVIVGYDLERGKIAIVSGNREHEEFGLGFFEFLWQDSDYWAMVALAPGRLPVTAREVDYAAAVAALERIGRLSESRESYRALTGRWPTSLPGLFGLGNVEYALGDLAAAERDFRRAVEAHPRSAPAFNNLAHTLAELGRLAEAEVAARTAVELGGPTLPEAQKTLKTILERR